MAGAGAEKVPREVSGAVVMTGGIPRTWNRIPTGIPQTMMTRCLIPPMTNIFGQLQMTKRMTDSGDLIISFSFP